jgi:hypothetical protein
MKWRTIQGCVAGALLGGALSACGGDSAHVSAGALQPDTQPAKAAGAASGPAGQRDCANAGMMNATPSGRETLCRLNN